MHRAFLDQREVCQHAAGRPAHPWRSAGILLGDDFNYMGSDGNYYVGDTGWHSDGWQARRLDAHQDRLLPRPADARHRRAARDPRQPPGRRPVRRAAGRDIAKSDAGWGIPGRDVPAMRTGDRAGRRPGFQPQYQARGVGGGSLAAHVHDELLCQRYPDDKLDELRDYIGGSARSGSSAPTTTPWCAPPAPNAWRHLEQVHGQRRAPGRTRAQAPPGNGRTVARLTKRPMQCVPNDWDHASSGGALIRSRLCHL